jgi:hypothetical protein
MSDTSGVREARADDGVASTDDRTRAERLAADAELLEALRADNFEGVAWATFAEALGSYGLQVLRAWIYSGEVFRSLQLRKIPCPPLPSDRDWTPDVADELANETVARALSAFREKVLRPGRWSPERGATLTSFFIGQCLFQFPSVFRAWLRESKPLPLGEDAVSGSLTMRDESGFFGSGVGDSADPAELALARVEADEAIRLVADERTRAVLRLRAAGYSYVEIAELIGSSAKTVEMLLYRHRRRVRGRSDDQR